MDTRKNAAILGVYVEECIVLRTIVTRDSVFFCLSSTTDTLPIEQIH